MNTITNDFGKAVLAVGAPGSIERVKVQYPKAIRDLINIVRRNSDSTACMYIEAHTYLSRLQVSQMERQSIIEVCELSQHFGAQDER